MIPSTLNDLTETAKRMHVTRLALRRIIFETINATISECSGGETSDIKIEDIYHVIESRVTNRINNL